MRTPVAALRRRLTLQAPLETADGAGGANLSWEDVAVLWAAVRPLRGASEGLWASQPASRERSEIVIRFRSGVRPEMRFVGDGRTWDVIGVHDPDGRRARLVCLCEERPL